jgi:hypothetical protein
MIARFPARIRFPRLVALALTITGCYILSGTQPPQCPIDVHLDSGQAEKLADSHTANISAFLVTNTSTSAILGFVVRLDLVDTHTKEHLSRQIVAALRASPDGKPKPLQPGDSIHLGHHPIPATPSGSAKASYQPVVDLVVYADGSLWGPRSLKESTKFLAKFPPEFLHK